MVVEEGALLRYHPARFPYSLSLTDELFDSNVDFSHEFKKDFDDNVFFNGKLFHDSSINSSIMLQETDERNIRERVQPVLSEVILEEELEISGSSALDDADIESERSAIFSAAEDHCKKVETYLPIGPVTLRSREGSIQDNLETRSVEQNLGPHCRQLSDLNLGISPLPSTETVTYTHLQMNKNVTPILQNYNGRDPSAGRETFTEDVLLSEKNKRSYETLPVACKQIESKLEGTVPSSVALEKSLIVNDAIDAPYDELGHKRNSLLTAIRDRNNRNKKPSSGSLHDLSNKEYNRSCLVKTARSLSGGQKQPSMVGPENSTESLGSTKNTSDEQYHELDRKRNALLGVLRDRSIRKRNPSLAFLNESKTEECNQNSRAEASSCRLSLGAASSSRSDAELDCDSGTELFSSVLQEEKDLRNSAFDVLDESGREKNTLLLGVDDLSIPSIETVLPNESKSYESNQHTKPVSTRMPRYRGQNESSLVIPGDKLDIYGSNRNVLLEAIRNRKDSKKAAHALFPVSSSSSFLQALPTGSELESGRSALLLAIQERGEKMELKKEISDVP
jgi:hypothetical protein